MTEIVGASSGKLSGKTVAIKDNMHIAGVPMSCGSHFMRGFVSSCTAPVVTRILDAGRSLVALLAALTLSLSCSLVRPQSLLSYISKSPTKILFNYGIASISAPIQGLMPDDGLSIKAAYCNVRFSCTVTTFANVLYTNICFVQIVSNNSMQ